MASLSAWPSAAAVTLQPELIFKDTFDVSAESDDINFENDKRQSGSAAPLTYAENAPADELTQLSTADAPGRLRLASPSYVSPNHNFTEGSQVIIEFDVDPGFDDDPSDGLSSDWCGVVFGASSQNPFIFSSDGMGILFRNSGAIEVWETQAQGPIYSGPGDVTIPTDRPFRVRIEMEAAGFTGAPATVKLFIDGQQARLDRNSLEHVKQTGFRNNYITLQGLGFPGPWAHAFDNLTVSAVPCLTVAPRAVNQVAGQISEPITVTVPAQLIASQAAQVTVRALNPSVAVPVGADAGGRLTLNFAAGGAASQTFRIAAVGPGLTTIEVAGPDGTCTIGSVSVAVAAGIGLAQVVFSDNFNTSVNSFDVNFENSGGRQAGTAGVLNYLESENTAAGGPGDAFTQVNTPEAPNALAIINQAGGVSPAHNFIEGPEFAIECEVHPGANNPARDSANWAAIVFGTTAPNQFVISPDGFGILFRNDGRIEVWDAGTRVFGSELANALPPGPLRVRIEVKTANFQGGTPATIKLFVNDTQVKISSTDALEHVKAAGFRGNYITLEGIGEGLVHTFDNFKVSALACAHFDVLRLNSAPARTETVQVEIPAALNATSPATVRVISRNPTVAVPAGATDGELSLNFAAGGPIRQAVNLNVLSKGVAVFELANAHGVCVGDPLVVVSSSALVKNPSFELNYNPTWPHYGPIDLWETSGGRGVNTASGPFHDNGLIPDRSRIAFLQGSATASQMLTGLKPGKRYWVQVRFNARGCCGGAVPDMTVRFEGADLGSVAGIQPVGGNNHYYFRNFAFTPQTEAGLLEIAAAAPGGDSTLLLDAVTVVEREEGQVVVQNPSFEASGLPPAPGVISPARIGGWVGEGTFGVNFTGGGPFADNGTNPDQDLVAFIQGKGALSQTLVGLLAGQTYTVRFAYNARTGNQPRLRVTAGEAVVLETEVTAVGGSAGYHTGSGTFRAGGNTAVLRFEQTAEGDHTVLLDDVKVLGQAVNLPCIEVTPPELELGVGGSDASILVKIPAELIASSPATVTVTTLNPAVVTIEGALNNILTLEFPPGGELTRNVTVRGVARGSAQLQFANPHGVCFNRERINVAVIGSFVRNPSFEANFHSAFPGYGPINAWSSEGPGNTGINNASGPFHDNGRIPDRAQVALLQVDKTLRQTIVGLTPGRRYWLQFYYNTRNCCGGTIDLTVRWDGADLANLPAITPVGGANPYYFHHVTFTPAGASGVLEFSTTSAGDATVLLDGVSIVQRDADQILIVNPSFEASGIVAFPGYIQPNSIAGWSAGGGGRGVNVSGVGPFADNGVNPDQDSVAFLQGQGTFISQNIAGLIAGQNYTLTFAANARGGNLPRLRVSFADAVLLEEDISPVGGSNPYLLKHLVFTAAGTEGVLRFEQTAAGDNTVVLDDVKLAPGGTLPPSAPRLVFQRGVGRTLKISWPATATGYLLEATTRLPGGWSDAGLPPIVIEGSLNTVTLPIGTAGDLFLRLRKP